MLSTVSNYHPLGFPSTQDPQKIKTPNISFHEHIATPEKQRYIPTSPCNRIMYFIKSGELRHLKNYLKFLQLKDNIPEFQTDEPWHKKQRLTGRARRVDVFCLKQKYLSPELADMIRQSNIDRWLWLGPDQHLHLYWILHWPAPDSSRRPIDGRYCKWGSCPKASRIWMVSSTPSAMTRRR